MKRVAPGLAHTCALATGGLYCWGLGDSGQLGNGVRLQSSRPVQASNLNLIETVVSGRAHNCARQLDSTVLCWGAGGAGQLGNGGRSDRTVAAPVAGLNGIVALALGGDLSCSLSETGAVQCWGRNDEGQVGAGDLTAKSRPTPVPLPGAVDELAVGGAHACARIGGTVYCWGHGDCGEMGDGAMIDRLVPVAVPGISDARSLALGDHQSCVVRQSGPVLCWGDGASGIFGGQLGKVSKPLVLSDFGSGVRAVAGPGRLCVLNDMGRFVCRGGGVNANRTPVLDANLRMLTEGTAAVALSRGHVCTLAPPGTLSCVGENGLGQLGTGDLMDRTDPVAVRFVVPTVKATAIGDEHTCAVVEGGSVFCFGNNRNGQIGDGARFVEATPITTPLPCP